MAPGDLHVRLPLGDQEILVFAPNLYAGFPGSQGFRGYGRLPTTYFSWSTALDTVCFISPGNHKP